MSESCPECGAPRPAEKTCANITCRKQYRRSDAGRADAKYCSRSCAQAQAARNFRWREVASELGLPPVEVDKIIQESITGPGVQYDPETALRVATPRLRELSGSGQVETAQLRMRLLKQIELTMPAPPDDRTRPLRRAMTRVGHRMLALAMHHDGSSLNSYLFDPVDRLTDAQGSGDPARMLAATDDVLDAAEAIPSRDLPVSGNWSDWEHQLWDAVEMLRAIRKRDSAPVLAQDPGGDQPDVLSGAQL
jgi:hypothetical protein